MSDMRVLLTGARKDGIGGAIARCLAEDAQARDRKLRIILSAKGSDQTGLKQLVDDLDRMGADAWFVAGDITDPEFPGYLAQEAAGFCGGLDTVIFNAGQSHRGRLSDAFLGDWDRMLNLNARAAWLLAQAAFPWLAKAKGSFTATASISGTVPQAGRGAYPVAKAALIMACQVLALEWGQYGVRVNTVSPGLIAKPGLAKQYATGITPLGRPGTADDIARVVAFLAGPDAAYVTGQNVVADGGFAFSALNQIPVVP